MAQIISVGEHNYVLEIKGNDSTTITFNQLDFATLYKILYNTQKHIIPELMANERDKLLSEILA